jgi:hypothetical protein
MPLHRQQEGMPARPRRRFHRFDHAILRPGDGYQSVAEPGDALVMGGRHRQRETGLAASWPQDRGEQAAFGEPHRVRPERAGLGPVPGRGGEMLAQGPATGHVEQLHAPADTEHGQPGGQRGREQLQFRLIAFGVDTAGPRIRLGAVPRRVEIAAAGQDQPVQPAQGGRDPRRWRQQHGNAARLGDLVDVIAGQQRGRSVPRSPPGRLGVGGQPDDRRAHSGVT